MGEDTLSGTKGGSLTPRQKGCRGSHVRDMSVEDRIYSDLNEPKSAEDSNSDTKPATG